ncbi:MAG: hypothetical protein LC687_08335, partial [Actinobacteria bacterium]|nr:hypothetical protein [Actinomycetota bacterium]
MEISTGIDSNANGTLDPSEVDNTDSLCHGDNGLIALISTQEVAAGINCSLGGILIQSGLDINGSLQLDITEVQTTAYICNHNDAAVNGYNSLVYLSTESTGTNCAYGGQRIDTGLDANRNTILDIDEILNSKYICNGQDGASATATNALVTLTPEPSGVNCESGGSLITTGLDGNDNGIIDTNEIASKNYVCDGLDATSSLIDILNESTGSNCAYGGQKIVIGIDSDSNGILSTNEINKTSFICNASGNNTSSLPTNNYLSIRWSNRELYNSHSECASASSVYSSFAEYYDLATGTSVPAYATCLYESCSVQLSNGSINYNFNSGISGSSCTNTQSI